ncbi:MAG: hypothetical protein E3J72_03435 [Planctomycetota bacterium]|nr:MAG: hypothetical protein E3J72_03435 [Planctomycetota bacterium]
MYGASGAAGITNAINNLSRATSKRGGWRIRRIRCSNPEKNIPMQIKLLGSRRPAWRTKALQSLISTTFRDAGPEQEAWKNWYRENRDRERADWACDALERAGVSVLGLSLERFIPACIEALRNAAVLVRSAAFYLLKHYTGRKAHFPVHANAQKREPHIQEWFEWWNTKGIRNSKGGKK